MRRALRSIISTLAVAGLAAACGGDSSGPGSGGSTSTAITVGNNFFNPNATTVPNGATVTWTWGAGSLSHNVTFDGGPASATQTSGTYTRTFTAAGSYPYHCTVHGTSMSGTVVVQ